MLSTERSYGFSFARLRNVAVVLLAVGLGAVAPQAAYVVETLTLLIVTFLMYSSLRGTRISPEDVPAFLFPTAAVLVLTYVAIPLLGISWARVLLSDDPLVGVAVMLAAPATAGSAIVWTRSSRGNAELSGLTSASTILLAPLVTPYVLARLLGERVDLPMVRLELELLFIIAASVLLLLTLPNGWLGDRTIDFGSEASIFLLIYAGVGTAGLSETSTASVLHVGLVAFAVFVVGLVGALVFASLLSLDRGDLPAVFFSGTLKNLGIALLIVFSFGNDQILLTVIVYYVCQQLYSAAIVDGGLFTLAPPIR